MDWSAGSRLEKDEDSVFVVRTGDAYSQDVLSALISL